LLILLSILLGIAACGEKPVPRETVTKGISRLMAFSEERGQFSGMILIAQEGHTMYEAL
jgi:hypothetical protein